MSNNENVRNPTFSNQKSMCVVKQLQYPTAVPKGKYVRLTMWMWNQISDSKNSNWEWLMLLNRIRQMLWSPAWLPEHKIAVVIDNLHCSYDKQDKSEGFDSCNRPGNLTQVWLKSSIFQTVWPWNLMGWPRKIIGHLFYTTGSFVHHPKSIGEFKLELQSGNTQFGPKSVIPVWPCNLTNDLEKQ